MYKNNSQNSNKLMGCSSLQLSSSLTIKCHAVGYNSYTKLCWPLEKQLTHKLHICFFLINRQTLKKQKNPFFADVQQNKICET